MKKTLLLTLMMGGMMAGPAHAGEYVYFRCVEPVKKTQLNFLIQNMGMYRNVVPDSLSYRLVGDNITDRFQIVKVGGGLSQRLKYDFHVKSGNMIQIVENTNKDSKARVPPSIWFKCAIEEIEFKPQDKKDLQQSAEEATQQQSLSTPSTKSVPSAE